MQKTNYRPSDTSLGISMGAFGIAGAAIFSIAATEIAPDSRYAAGAATVAGYTAGLVAGAYFGIGISQEGYNAGKDEFRIPEIELRSGVTDSQANMYNDVKEGALLLAKKAVSYIVSGPRTPKTPEKPIYPQTEIPFGGDMGIVSPEEEEVKPKQVKEKVVGTLAATSSTMPKHLESYKNKQNTQSNSKKFDKSNTPAGGHAAAIASERLSPGRKIKID